MKLLVCLVSLLAAALVSANDLTKIVGRYSYEQYHVTLPNGKVLQLADMGAREASLEIAANGTLTLRMTMSDGRVISQDGRVIELHLKDNRGYWIAQWPDMSYPVRADIEIEGTRLTSETKFDVKSDTERFGSVERAVLRKH